MNLQEQIMQLQPEPDRDGIHLHPIYKDGFWHARRAAAKLAAQLVQAIEDAHTAGRDQGLREAADAVRSKTHNPDDPDNCVWTAAYDHVAAEHAAAIEQLRA